MDITYEVADRVKKRWILKDKVVYDLVRIIDFRPPSDIGSYEWCSTRKVLKTFNTRVEAELAKFDKERAFL